MCVRARAMKSTSIHSCFRSATRACGVQKWIASTGRRLFRAGVLLLEEFHGMLAEGLLPVFIQFMKTAMYHLLYRYSSSCLIPLSACARIVYMYIRACIRFPLTLLEFTRASVWECAGRMGGSTSEERTNDDDIDPKLSFSELIEVILREVYRQKSPKGSESSAKVIDERMQMLKAELIDTPLFHSAHFDNSPLCRCTTARRCQVCAYVQSLKMALEKRSARWWWWWWWRWRWTCARKVSKVALVLFLLFGLAFL